MSTQPESISVVMAKPSKNDFELLWELHSTLSEHEKAVEEVRNHPDELGCYQEEFHEIASTLDKVLDSGALGRVLMVCQSLVEQACNPTIDHVDFTDEIKEAVTAYRALQSSKAPIADTLKGLGIDVNRIKRENMSPADQQEAKLNLLSMVENSGDTP